MARARNERALRGAGLPYIDYSLAMKRRRSSGPFVLALALLGGCAHRTASAAPAPDAPANRPDAVTARRLEFIERTVHAVAAVRGLPLRSRPRIEPLGDDAFAAACYADAVANLVHNLPTSSEDLEAKRQECRDMLGFYDSLNDRIVVRSTRVGQLSDAERVTVLAHEVEHWLVAHALPALPKPHGGEEAMALRALKEGDASVTSGVYVLGLRGVRFADDIQHWISELGKNDKSSINDNTYFYYALGARFVAELFARGGFRAVDDAFRRPPTSTAEILHADRYLAHEPRHAVATSLPLPPPFATDSLGGSMGELEVSRFLTLCVPPASAIAVAGDYAADDLTRSKQRSDAQKMVRWIILWRSEAAATSFVRTLNQCKDLGVQLAQDEALTVMVMGLEEAAARTYAAAVLADVRAAHEATTRPRP